MGKRGERGGGGRSYPREVGREINSSRIDVEWNIDFFSKGDAPALQYFFLIPSSISLLLVLRSISTINDY